jgi:RING finger protein 113A
MDELKFNKPKKKTFRKRQIEEEDEQNATVVKSTDLKKKKTVELFSFKASGTAQSLVENTAFRTLDVDGYDDIQHEYETNTDGVYNGLKGYEEYVNKRKTKVTQSTAGQLRAGPLKGQSNVRISCRFDYAPAICKDYKETGYCGFGDGCVFMHDRGDYKQGWELDKEWEEQQRLAQEASNVDYFVQEQEIESDDDLPFACFICRKAFKHPVVTKCKHYFCEACAIKKFAKSPGCFICGQNTNGVFNTAKDIFEKIAKKKKRFEEKKKQFQDEEQFQNDTEEDEQVQNDI